MRLINREDAVNTAVRFFIEFCGGAFHEDGQRELNRRLREIPFTEPTGWIPCSERLPEEEGWYLVTIQNDKTRKRRTENDLFTIGIAEAHKLTPYKFCKDGHRQTVIAWMPLPEPYKAS